MPDVFYNLLKFDRAMPNAIPDVGVEVKFPLTLTARESKTQAIVTEILGVRYDTTEATQLVIGSMLGSVTAAYKASLSFRALTNAEADALSGGLTIGNINVLDSWGITATEIVDTAVGVQYAASKDGGVVSHDLTFGTGLGRLVPGDRVFFNQDAVIADLSTGTFGLEIAYRQQLVGFDEWRGILAGYQQDGAA